MSEEYREHAEVEAAGPIEKHPPSEPIVIPTDLPVGGPIGFIAIRVVTNDIGVGGDGESVHELGELNLSVVGMTWDRAWTILRGLVEQHRFQE